ncbi:MAG: hypothetical protein K2P76_14235 [Lachnospiraceae bacterium]|nr:hypothetical protein [Lachnospiraceae bacterium]MDE6981901.1 hypothetical protein [Lachnospiraceae bacterium]
MTYETFKQKADELLDFKKAKERISYSLVNYVKNANWLCNVPHWKFLDLAIVYQTISFIGPIGIHTLLVDNGQMNDWNITEPVLYRLAKKNMPTLLPMQIDCIDDVIDKLEEQCEVSESDRKEMREKLGMLDVPMYMITNTYQTYGAACILYDNALRAFSMEQECSLFLLPTSIHEMMVIPDKGIVKVDDLKQMMKDVNMSLKAEEKVLFLSESVYLYSESNGIRFA